MRSGHKWPLETRLNAGWEYTLRAGHLWFNRFITRWDGGQSIALVISVTTLSHKRGKVTIIRLVLQESPRLCDVWRWMKRGRTNGCSQHEAISKLGYLVPTYQTLNSECRFHVVRERHPEWTANKNCRPVTRKKEIQDSHAWAAKWKYFHLVFIPQMAGMLVTTDITITQCMKDRVCCWTRHFGPLYFWNYTWHIFKNQAIPQQNKLKPP